MRRVIFKYELDIEGITDIPFNEDTDKVVLFQKLGDKMSVWIDHEDVDTRMSYREFYIYGTGHRIPIKLTHLKSVLATPYIWHLYIN